ncbi:MAG: hypothetical protein WD733_03585 [Bryobacterales bacterium]
MPNLPEIPAFDSVLGLLSALLLLAAAIYLVRARSSSAPGLHRLRWDKEAGSEGGELFAEFVPDVTAHRLSFVGSMFLHVLLVASLPVLQLLEPGPLLFDMNHYDVVLLEYRPPDRPLSVPSDLAKVYRPDRQDPEAQSEEVLGLPEAENEQTQQAQGPLEGPVIAVSKQEKQPEPRALIEIAAGSELPVGPGMLPDLPPALALSLENQQAAMFAQFRLVRFVLPGQPVSAPSEGSLADLGLTDAPRLDGTPALPVPMGSFLVAGDVWNALEGLSGPAAPGFGDGILQPGGGGGGDIVSALAFHLAMQQGALGQLFGEHSMVALGGSGENKPFRTGAAEGPESGGWGRGKLTPVPRKFHGIILVSNSLGTLPEAVGELTGNPVYTVYVDVPGAPRKWILQFCVPQGNQVGMEITGEIVRVLGRKSVDPPYAFRKEPLELEIAPTLERLSQLPQRVVAYATVDAEGNLQNLRMVRGADPETDRIILASLRSWEFTPAFRDGEPVEVEALFGIPLY